MNSTFQVIAAIRRVSARACGVSKSTMSAMASSAPRPTAWLSRKRRNVGGEFLQIEVPPDSPNSSNEQRHDAKSTCAARRTPRGEPERKAEPLPPANSRPAPPRERRGEDRMERVHQRGRGRGDTHQRRMRGRERETMPSAPPIKRCGQRRNRPPRALERNTMQWPPQRRSSAHRHEGYCVMSASRSWPPRRTPQRIAKRGEGGREHGLSFAT